MSTFVWMKILESAPSRYDRGINLLTLGRIEKIYNQLLEYVNQGDKVLDLGCGTGALSLRAAAKGATVKGIDLNPGMLGIAQQRAEDAKLTSRVDFLEMGVAELGQEKSESYDVVMSGLCFSELTEGEVLYALSQSWRVLRQGGILLVADEARAQHWKKRILNSAWRLPLLLLTYLLTQTTTHPIAELDQKIESASFDLVRVERSGMGNFIEVIARKKGKAKGVVS